MGLAAGRNGPREAHHARHLLQLAVAIHPRCTEAVERVIGDVEPITLRRSVASFGDSVFTFIPARPPSCTRRGSRGTSISTRQRRHEPKGSRSPSPRLRDGDPGEGRGAEHARAGGDAHVPAVDGDGHGLVARPRGRAPDRAPSPNTWLVLSFTAAAFTAADRFARARSPRGNGGARALDRIRREPPSAQSDAWVIVRRGRAGSRARVRAWVQARARCGSAMT